MSPCRSDRSVEIRYPVAQSGIARLHREASSRFQESGSVSSAHEPSEDCPSREFVCSRGEVSASRAMYAMLSSIAKTASVVGADQSVLIARSSLFDDRTAADSAR